MSKLFKFLTKNECSGVLTFASKVFKVFYIVLASFSAIIFLINGIMSAEYEPLLLFVMIIAGGTSFFIILFIGLLIETMLLSFSIITKNHYEELVEKGKLDEEIISKSKPNDSSYSRLDRLNELKKMGIITEEEFIEKKKEILEGL